LNEFDQNSIRLWDIQKNEENCGRNRRTFCSIEPTNGTMADKNGGHVGHFHKAAESMFPAQQKWASIFVLFFLVDIFVSPGN
jgi:hypothetical protein